MTLVAGHSRRHHCDHDFARDRRLQSICRFTRFDHHEDLAVPRRARAQGGARLCVRHRRSETKRSERDAKHCLLHRHRCCPARACPRPHRAPRACGGTPARRRPGLARRDRGPCRPRDRLCTGRQAAWPHRSPARRDRACGDPVHPAPGRQHGRGHAVPRRGGLGPARLARRTPQWGVGKWSKVYSPTSRSPPGSGDTNRMRMRAR